MILHEALSDAIEHKADAATRVGTAKQGTRSQRPGPSSMDVRRAKRVLEVYQVLARLTPADARRGLSTTDIASLAGTTAGWMTDAFGGKVPPRHPRISSAWGPGERAIAEAKQFSIEPFLRGWQLECEQLRLTTRHRLAALVPVLASWAGHHPGLAAVYPTRLPAGVETIIELNFPTDPAAAALRKILVRGIRDILNHQTPVTVFSNSRRELASLPLEDSRELDRKAAKLVEAIGEFRSEAMRHNAIDHPELAFVLRKAAKVFSPEGSVEHGT